MYTYVIPSNYSYIPIQPSEIRATRFRTGFVHEMIILHSTSFKTNPHLYSTSTGRRYFSSECGETAVSAAVCIWGTNWCDWELLRSLAIPGKCRNMTKPAANGEIWRSGWKMMVLETIALVGSTRFWAITGASIWKLTMFNGWKLHKNIDQKPHSSHDHNLYGYWALYRIKAY